MLTARRMWNRVGSSHLMLEAAKMDLRVRLEFCAENELRIVVLPDPEPAPPPEDADAFPVYRAPDFTSGEVCLPAFCYPAQMPMSQV